MQKLRRIKVGKLNVFYSRPVENISGSTSKNELFTHSFTQVGPFMLVVSKMSKMKCDLKSAHTCVVCCSIPKCWSDAQHETREITRWREREKEKNHRPHSLPMRSWCYLTLQQCASFSTIDLYVRWFIITIEWLIELIWLLKRCLSVSFYIFYATVCLEHASFYSIDASELFFSSFFLSAW